MYFILQTIMPVHVITVVQAVASLIFSWLFNELVRLVIYLDYVHTPMLHGAGLYPAIDIGNWSVTTQLSSGLALFGDTNQQGTTGGGPPQPPLLYRMFWLLPGLHNYLGHYMMGSFAVGVTAATSLLRILFG
jgi:hypothetical protein